MHTFSLLSPFLESLFLSLSLFFLHINFPSKYLNDKSSVVLHPDPTWKAEIIDTYGYNAIHRGDVLSPSSRHLLCLFSSLRNLFEEKKNPSPIPSFIYFSRYFFCTSREYLRVHARQPRAVMRNVVLANYSNATKNALYKGNASCPK